MDFFLALLLLALLGLLVWQFFFRPQNTSDRDQMQKLEQERDQAREDVARIRFEQEQKQEQWGKMQQELQTLSKEKDESTGQNKQMWAQNHDLKKENELSKQENKELREKISQAEAQEKQKEKEQQKALQDLTEMKKSFEEEKLRIRREDEERRVKILEEQNRIWDDHEKSVLFRLKDICQSPHLNFSFFENTDLPPDFDGSLKPDFLISFLDQYLIFDAKRSKDYATYIGNQVKSTAKKVKGKTNIYPLIFFVIPSADMASVKKRYFLEEGFSFFVISESALEPVLALLRKIDEYERLQEFDPQDREALANLIAHYDRHISFQNATNIYLTKESISLMKSKEKLPSDFTTEIEAKKTAMRPLKTKDSEIRRLSQDIEKQGEEVQKMIAPQTDISPKEVEQAKGLFL